jgi:hypothetical protein
MNVLVMNKGLILIVELAVIQIQLLLLLYFGRNRGGIHSTHWRDEKCIN